jgi:hypothetical protein
MLVMSPDRLEFPTSDVGMNARSRLRQVHLIKSLRPDD